MVNQLINEPLDDKCLLQELIKRPLDSWMITWRALWLGIHLVIICFHDTTSFSFFVDHSYRLFVGNVQILSLIPNNGHHSQGGRTFNFAPQRCDVLLPSYSYKRINSLIHKSFDVTFRNIQLSSFNK